MSERNRYSDKKRPRGTGKRESKIKKKKREGKGGREPKTIANVQTDRHTHKY